MYTSSSLQYKHAAALYLQSFTNISWLQKKKKMRSCLGYKDEYNRVNKKMLSWCNLLLLNATPFPDSRNLDFYLFLPFFLSLPFQHRSGTVNTFFFLCSLSLHFCWAILTFYVCQCQTHQNHMYKKIVIKIGVGSSMLIITSNKK